MIQWMRPISRIDPALPAAMLSSGVSSEAPIDAAPIRLLAQNGRA